MAAAALAALAVTLLTGCGSDDGDDDGGEAAPGPRTTTTEDDRTRPWKLFTHCGIEWIHVDGTWYQTEPPLTNGAGSPPEGWGNPEQQGWLTVTETEAVFTDDAGHEVSFRPRLGADGPAEGCQ